jgi:indole-3-glycerol phosphate synthase
MITLETILEAKCAEVAARKKQTPVEAIHRSDLPRLDFAAALRAANLSVIAEIKRQSPSRGLIAEHVYPGAIARRYRDGGASALSVLTDESFFGARPDDLAIAKKEAMLPVLRKDFIVDAYQIHEAAQLGADAVLLIVAALSSNDLEQFVGLAHKLGLAALIEVHTKGELDHAVKSGATIIGVNNRNLSTMRVDLATCLRLRTHIPSHCFAVAESGIRSCEYVVQLERAGYDAILVGETLMEADDPAQRLASLLGRTSSPRESHHRQKPAETRR